MTSHELAKILLANDDLPIATHANNHTYASGESRICDCTRVGKLKHYAGEHIIIGNMNRKALNSPNWYIQK